MDLQNLSGNIKNLYIENSVIYGGKITVGVGSKTNNANVVVESISNSDVYQEPSFDYLIVKTSEKAIQERGSLYEATRLAWRAGERITNYKYVISVIGGVVQEVYVVNKWNIIQSGSNAGRYEFNGEIASLVEARALKGKKIPAKYRKVGMASPVLYKKLID